MVKKMHASFLKTSTLSASLTLGLAMNPIGLLFTTMRSGSTKPNTAVVTLYLTSKSRSSLLNFCDRKPSKCNRLTVHFSYCTNTFCTVPLCSPADMNRHIVGNQQTDMLRCFCGMLKTSFRNVVEFTSSPSHFLIISENVFVS